MRSWFVAAIISCVSIVAVALIALDDVQSSLSGRSEMQTYWKRHREECLKTPLSEYTKDRSRALRGVVRNAQGEPVADASVLCLSLPLLHVFVSQSQFSTDGWKGLVEVETRTDAHGRYVFPNLDVGTRTICVDAKGYAPATENMITVEDGMAPRVDVHLEPPKTLRVRSEPAAGKELRVCLLSNQWWPEPMLAVTTGGVAQFDRLGDAFSRGIVLVESSAEESGWVPAASYDLAIANEIVVTPGAPFEASPENLPEIASMQFPERPLDEATRKFFALHSPMALAWSTTEAEIADADLGNSKSGDLSGFAGGAFLPVLLTPQDGGPSQLTFSSEASQYEVMNIPAGMYRVRGYQRRGSFTFARTAVVRPGMKTRLESGLTEEIDFEEENEYEIQGMVTAANGQPIQNAAVVVQDVQNFRSFLEQAKTDEMGFFSVAKVRPGRRYFAFATPPNAQNAVRNFSYFMVSGDLREVFVDLKLYENRVVGRLPSLIQADHLELVEEDSSDGGGSFLWKFTPDERGAFLVENVPPGSYFVRTENPTVPMRSFNFTCGETGSVEVQWDVNLPQPNK